MKRLVLTYHADYRQWTVSAEFDGAMLYLTSIGTWQTVEQLHGWRMLQIMADDLPLLADCLADIEFAISGVDHIN